MSSQERYVDTLQVIKGFCAKSDGKDKLTALVQYLCMFLSAGEPGTLKKIQASVTAARKVFRIMRPLEAMTPLLIQPKLSGSQPWQHEATAKLKDLLMATYFAADHVVWAFQIGLITDKKVGERAQKVSLYSWALGSITTMILEGNAILRVSARQRPGETEVDWAKRQEQARQEVSQHLLVFVHGLMQALTAVGLLQLLPWKPRTVGLLGSIASAMNCYFLLPPFPKRAPALKPAAAVSGAVPAGASEAGQVAGKLVAKVA